jgi:hypothetical protein
MIVVCCQVEISASGWSLVQRSPTECCLCVCVCDREASIMRRSSRSKGCCAMERSKVRQLIKMIFLRLLEHTRWRTTFGRTVPDERLARRKDLYLTTHGIHRRQTSMPVAEFEPTIAAREWPQAHALDFTATEIRELLLWYPRNLRWLN